VITVVPKLRAVVSSQESRTGRQIEALGGDGTDMGGFSVAVEFPSLAGGRGLLARALVDFLIRLEPLVDRLVVTGSGERELVDEVGKRYPIDVDETVRSSVDLTVTAANFRETADLLTDGAGWVAAMGATTNADDDGNPVGPLLAADLAAGEVFKMLFAMAVPQSPVVARFSSWTGEFSAYSYRMGSESPPIGPVDLDATLIGIGGVGAGTLLVLGALGDLLSGRLVLVDGDVVKHHNLNRLLYASVRGAEAEAAKVNEAQAYLAALLPRVAVEPHQQAFGDYKARIPRRRDRRFPVVATGLDSDEARREVQFETPCVLIDGSTGANVNCRVERVWILRSGCLGCTRPASGLGPSGECDDFPDDRAPSVAFLSAFPGILTGGELIKHAMGDGGSLPGYFEHIFLNGPNEDLAGVPMRVQDCLVGCGTPAVMAQAREKCV
jgi:hypothetical protein